ncbi:unnamed protein product [Linum tenue]|uniref:EDR1/CTR1/ARMC3-like peptidase-like domain-containing protein n=1 Tax=Linum tenue TaxID=586396 RepID=A0AAV0H5R6_9ROSI|nr:unnamed protein product [Linum tenue]
MHDSQNYNALNYDDKILDGFYDLHGILTVSRSDIMPSVVELQGTPVTESITWEAVLVDRAANANMLKLEQKAQEIASKLRSESVAFADSNLVKKLAALVSNYIGESVGDPENMSRAWHRLSYSLKATLGSMVLPLGSLTIRMARHRALMFKVLADSVGSPSRLVKGHQFTGSDDVVMKFVKLDDGREYIIDLMADPETLIPSDAAGLNVEYGVGATLLLQVLEEMMIELKVMNLSTQGFKLKEIKNPESGVNAPPSLFTEFEQLSLQSTEGKSVMEKDDELTTRNRELESNKCKITMILVLCAFGRLCLTKKCNPEQLRH